jgi:hypothetical protein
MGDMESDSKGDAIHKDMACHRNRTEYSSNVVGVGVIILVVM